MIGSPRLVAIAIAIAIGGCPSDRSDVRDPPAPIAEPTTDDRGLADAHAMALKRLRDAALPLLAAFDPIGAAQIGHAPWFAPPASRASRQRLRTLLGAARREAKDIDADRLSPEQAMLLVAIEHALLQIDGELGSATPLRTDPGAYLRRTQPLVDAIATGIVPGSEADAALRSLATELGDVAGQLGAASPAALAAAIDDARVLGEALRRIPAIRDAPGLAAAANDAADATTALGDALASIAARIADAKPARWTDRLTPKPIDAVQRLPDRLGPERLRTLLQVEAITIDPNDLLAQLVAAIARLQAMRARVEAPEATVATAVTVARCRARWEPIATWAAAQPTLGATDRSIDCELVVRRLADRPRDDAELAIDLVATGVIAPIQAARRRDVDPALALVAGAWTAIAHRMTLTIAVVEGAQLPVASARAIDEAHDAACLAAAAVIVHGESADASDLSARLGGGCDHRPASHWVDAALARPPAALSGIALLLVGAGPADAIALHRFWWAPVGLVGKLAVPPSRVPESPRPATIEAIEPSP